jgi:hypothetical protein
LPTAAALPEALEKHIGQKRKEKDSDGADKASKKKSKN